MGRNTRIIELYGAPASGKTTLSEGLARRGVELGLKVQNFDNAIDDVRKVSLFNLISCVSLKSIFYAFLFLCFFIPRNKLRKRMTFIGWLKMSFLIKFYKKYTDYDIVICEEGVIQRIISWKSGEDKRSKKIDQVVCRYLRSLPHILYVYCSIDLENGLLRIKNRHRGRGRLDVINDDEKLTKEYFFESEQFLHYSDLLCDINKNIMILDMLSPKDILVNRVLEKESNIDLNMAKACIPPTDRPRLLLEAYRSLRDKYLLIRRMPYFKQLKHHIGNNTSIISSNCFAGRIMQDLKMEYNSPTLGLWMMPDDFAVFCSDLKHYLSADIQIVEHSKNELGEYKMTHPPKHPYPVGWIDGKLEVHFLHYHTAEEAISKWKRRAARVNYDNLLLIGSEQNGCTEEDVKAFDAIPYDRKLYFCSKPYPYKSVVYIKEFAKLGHSGDPYKQGHIYYRYLVNWLKENKRDD